MVMVNGDGVSLSKGPLWKDFSVKMTITYTAQVANSNFGCFLRLLFRWKGSIYKLIWKEFSIFVIAFYTLNFIYRFALDSTQKRIFEKVVAYCDMFNNLIPLAFVLGFYVSLVVGRWWDQFNFIPWPDRMAMFVTANVHGQDERGRLMRRTIMRYLCLSYVITMASISPPVKKRFPTWAHMTEAGFMLPNEEKIIDSLQTPHNKYFVPLAWATALISRARKEQKIWDDFAVKTLIDEVNTYRGMLGTLFNYDWISIPLVYTQTVTLATYTFFLSCLVGRQFVEDTQTQDMYIPIFTFLQFFFYMGWLKVAETLVNPFGEDDDDFDINKVIDRNLQVSYLVVDEMHSEHPQLIKDQYWDEVNFDLPYTAATASSKEDFHIGSAMNINLSPRDLELVPLQPIQEDVEAPDVVTTNPTDIPATTGFNVPDDVARSSSQINKKRLKHMFSKRSNSKLTGKSPGTRRQGRRSEDFDSVVSSCGAATPMEEHKLLFSQEDIFKMSDLECTDKGNLTDVQSQKSIDRAASPGVGGRSATRYYGVFVDDHPPMDQMSREGPTDSIASSDDRPSDQPMLPSSADTVKSAQITEEGTEIRTTASRASVARSVPRAIPRIGFVPSSGGGAGGTGSPTDSPMPGSLAETGSVTSSMSEKPEL